MSDFSTKIKNVIAATAAFSLLGLAAITGFALIVALYVLPVVLITGAVVFTLRWMGVL